MPTYGLVHELGETYPIEGEFMLGRGSGANRTLKDSEFSRKLAPLYISAAGLMARDGQSANGTFINDQRIYQPTILNPGDILRIGTSRFTLHASDVENVIPTVSHHEMFPQAPSWKQSHRWLGLNRKSGHACRCSSSGVALSSPLHCVV